MRAELLAAAAAVGGAEDLNRVLSRSGGADVMGVGQLSPVLRSQYDAVRRSGARRPHDRGTGGAFPHDDDPVPMRPTDLRDGPQASSQPGWAANQRAFIDFLTVQARFLSPYTRRVAVDILMQPDAGQTSSSDVNRQYGRHGRCAYGGANLQAEWSSSNDNRSWNGHGAEDASGWGGDSWGGGAWHGINRGNNAHCASGPYW